MNFEKLYQWLESVAGLSCNADEQIRMLNVRSIITDPERFRDAFMQTIDTVCSTLDALDEHYKELPAEFPQRSTIKEEYGKYVMHELCGVISAALRILSLPVPDSVTDLDMLRAADVVNVMTRLVRELTIYDSETVQNSEWYTAHAETLEQLHITARELSVMKRMIKKEK